MNALVAIAASFERPYLKEWCDWHLKLGFDRVFVYANNWTVDIDLGNDVQVIDFPGLAMQLHSYHDWLNRYSKDFDWALFADCDEFLCLNNFKSVQEMVDSYSSYFAVALNWKIFGSNGHTKVENNDYSVRKRFTKSQIGFNRHIKTLVNIRKCKECGILQDVHFITPHNLSIAMRNSFTISADKKEFVYGPWHTLEASSYVPYIAHYVNKSKEEFIIRRTAPTADSNLLRSNLKQFWIDHEKNEVVNLQLAT